jgi:hypothetical protein
LINFFYQFKLLKIQNRRNKIYLFLSIINNKTI